MKTASKTISLILFAVAMTVTAQKDSPPGGTNDVIQTGGAVTNDVGQVGGGSTNAPALTAPRPRVGVMHPQTLGSQPVTSVLVTPAVSSRAARWNVRGAANDWAPVDFGEWVFPHGTNHTSRFAVKTSGEVCADNIFGKRFTAVGVQMSAVPGLSAFDIFEEPDGRRFCWQDFALRRDTNDLVTAEILLKRNGDWIASSNGVVTVHERELSFDHDGWGQDADWVAANFTNANEILSVGYANWVDDQIGFGEENGLYKLTVTVDSAPPETVQLTVDDFAVAVTNAGEYVFLLEKGMPYELSVAPGWFADLFEYQMSDDIAPPGGVLMMSASPLLDEGGCWTLTKDQIEFERPSVVLAPRTFGNCIWRPKLRVSPGNWIPTANLNREIFTASVTDLSWWTSPSFTWSTSDDSVISLSETSGTQTVAVCDLAAARLRSAMLTLRMSVGFDWMEAIFVAGGQSPAPTDGIDRPTITMPTTLFINNDDDNADGQIDRGRGVASEDDDIVTARLSVAGGREGTLRLTDVFFPFDVFDGTVYEDSVNSQTPVSGNREWPVSALLGKSVTLRLDAGARSSHSLDSYVMAQFIPNDGTAYSTISRFTIVEPVAEPICNQATNVIESGEEHCYTINPCGVAVGHDAYFQLDVNPDDYSDTNIVWTAGSPGCVEFTGGGTGRTVRVRGVAPGRTTLTVQIGDCPSSPPSFPFEVVEETRVKVSAYIVSGKSEKPARTQADIEDMLREVNDIYAQVGMSFYLDSVTVTNIPAAYDLHYYSCATNNGVVTNYEWHVDRLVDVARNTGGLEVYFVNSFVGADNTLGVHSPSGIVLTARSTAHTMAHEFGHACGMRDIYLCSDDENVEVAGSFRQSYASDDWNGGSEGENSKGARYYRYLLPISELLHRLLMYGRESSVPSERGCDISTGYVFGVDENDSVNHVSTGIFKCHPTTRNPVHQ